MAKRTPTPNEIVNDPELFATAFLKIIDKQERLRPLKWNRVQARFHRDRTGRDIVLKARQLGISTYVQGEMFRRVVTGTRSAISLAHDDDSTTKLRLMADRFWQNCKFNDTQPMRQYANASLTTYPEFDSVVTIATAGNVNTGRGGTFTDFHGSEVAFWKDARKIVSGAMQGGNPDVILESTPNGAQGYFYDLCMDALRGKGVWKLHFFPWWWDESYKIALHKNEKLETTQEEQELVTRHKLTAEQIKWRRNKIAELRSDFKQEYPEDPITCFLTSGNSYFGDMTAMFGAPMQAEYNPDHIYVAGLDFGQTSDFTAMPVIDKTAKQQVDLLHMNKLEWKEMRRRIKERYRQWHCVQMIAEWNSIGGPNVEELRNDGIALLPFKTTNQSKSEIMAGLYEGLHTDGLQLQDWPAQRHEMSIFVSTQTTTGIWRLAAEGEGHDDTVIGLALAWLACRVGVTDREARKIAKDEIDVSTIPPDLLEAARMSGIDVDTLIKAEQERKAKE